MNRQQAPISQPAKGSNLTRLGLGEARDHDSTRSLTDPAELDSVQTTEIHEVTTT